MAELMTVGKQSACGALSRELSIEQFAQDQIDRLIDPATPEEERQRRIHRLTDGPPEFVAVRLDLPRRRKK